MYPDNEAELELGRDAADMLSAKAVATEVMVDNAVLGDGEEDTDNIGVNTDIFPLSPDNALTENGAVIHIIVPDGDSIGDESVSKVAFPFELDRFLAGCDEKK